MKSQNFRVLETINKKQYVFSTDKFKACCNAYIRRETERTGTKAKKKDLWDKLADETNMSLDSIHAWHIGSNGPGDVTYVKNIAKVLDTDYKNLMEEVLSENTEMNKNQSIPLEEQQRIYTEKEFIIKIYQMLIEEDELDNEGYGAFSSRMMRFIDNHALELSADTHQKLQNIVIEYGAHIYFTGCFRWQDIFEEAYGLRIDFSDRYRDPDWFDDEELEEWTDKIHCLITKNVVTKWKFWDKTTRSSYQWYEGDPDDKEAVLEFIRGRAEGKETPDVMGLELRPAEEFYDDVVYDLFEAESKYSWMYRKMLSAVFRHDFPELFSRLS